MRGPIKETQDQPTAISAGMVGRFVGLQTILIEETLTYNAEGEKWLEVFWET